MAKLVFGNYRHSLDEKNRVRIPVKIRESFASELYVIPGRTGCLYLVPEEKVMPFISKFTNVDVFSDDPINDVATSFLANTDTLKEDAQGRVLIKDFIKESAGIQKDIVFVGKGDFAEIWPSETYDRKFGVLTPDRISNMLAQLKNRGI